MVKSVVSSREKKGYIDFIYKLYANDSSFVDTSVFIVKTFLYQKDSFTRECFIRPVVYKDRDKTVAQVMFIHHRDFPYLQVGFFDALPEQQQAVNVLIFEARKEAKQRGLNKIVIGLNGHVSYGVGILTSGFEKRISFDSLYNKRYYEAYFDSMNLNKRSLYAYGFTIEGIKRRISHMTEKTHKRFDFRTMNMNNFENEMLLFGSLCNSCLNETFLYYDRDPKHLYELVKEMKFLLKPENLLFALKDGKEVGFYFWHPDYNEIIKPGVRNSLVKIFLNFLFRKKSIKNIKVNALGILPEHHSMGAIVGLFQEGLKYTDGIYEGGETSFVWDSNMKSRKINHGLGNSEARRYAVYIDEIKNGVAA